MTTKFPPPKFTPAAAEFGPPVATEVQRLASDRAASATDGSTGPMGRFATEMMVGGPSDGEIGAQETTVSGWRAAIGIGAIVALFAWLGSINVWYLVFAVGMLIAIFLHELGHYVTARWTGMKATQFFIGFGPRLWSFRRGETEFGVRALPLGAFVRIIGMNRDEPVPAADESRTYRVKSFPRRLLVISAGSIMHMLIAITLLFVVYAIDGQPVTRHGAAIAQATDSHPSPVGGAAAAAGVQPGDVIVAIGGESVSGPQQLGEVVRTFQAGDTVGVDVLRGGATADAATTVHLEATLLPSFDPDAAILNVNDRATATAADVTSVANDLKLGDTAYLGIADPTNPNSDGSPGTVYRPAKVVEVDGHHGFAPVALLGVSSHPNVETVQLSVPMAGVHAVTDIFPTAWEMSKGVVKVFNPINVWGHLDGTNNDITTRPTTMVGVGAVSADVGQDSGLLGMLFLLAMLNVFVGVFNMFPLLPLDGGHAAVAAYERVREALAGTRERYYADVSKLVPLTMVVVLALGFMFLSGLYLDITQPL